MKFEIFHKYHIRICAIVFLDIFGTFRHHSHISHCCDFFFILGRFRLRCSLTRGVLRFFTHHSNLLLNINKHIHHTQTHTHTHNRGTRGAVDTGCIQKLRRKS